MFIVCTTLAGCTSTQQNLPGYPEVYRLALNEFEGTSEITDQNIEEFSEFLSNLGRR
jgi:hypothetical protein